MKTQTFADKRCGEAIRHRRALNHAAWEKASEAMRRMIQHAPIKGDGNGTAYTQAETEYIAAIREAARYRAS